MSATEAHVERLIAMTDAQRTTLARSSKTALRLAWPHRHTSHRAPHVVRANVTMLRNLAALCAEADMEGGRDDA